MLLYLQWKITDLIVLLLTLIVLDQSFKLNTSFMRGNKSVSLRSLRIESSGNNVVCYCFEKKTTKQLFPKSIVYRWLVR